MVLKFDISNQLAIFSLTIDVLVPSSVSTVLIQCRAV